MASDDKPWWAQPAPPPPPGVEPVKDASPTEIGRLFARSKDRRVGPSQDLTRVAALPRRVWTQEQGEVFADRMTALLKRPWGTMRLRPVQAIGLYELAEYGGLFGAIRVGGGKTLLSFLAPTVLQRSKNVGFRPMLIVPAGLLEKTRRDWRELAQHWDITEFLNIVSYEKLGRVKAAEFLQKYSPDLIILDECHRVRNSKAAVTRRVKRYFQETGRLDLSHARVYCAAFSGTVTKRSIQDYQHILTWCFPPAHRPLPLHFEELLDWSDALDNNGKQIDPGELRVLCNPEENVIWEDNPTRAARLAYRRRLIETPGIVATEESPVDASLNMYAMRPPASPLRDAAFHTLHLMKETPDGFALADLLQEWRHAREIALGFFYVRIDGMCLKVLEAARGMLRAEPRSTTTDLIKQTFANGVQRAGRDLLTTCDVLGALEKRRERAKRTAIFTHVVTDATTLPAETRDVFREFADLMQHVFSPPHWWLEPRRVWAAFVRDKIKHSRTLDSEFQVRQWAADQPECKELIEWLEVQKQFEPETHPCWFDETVLQAVDEWARKNHGIVWVEHRCVGEKLEKDFGWPYYSNQGRDGRNRFIDDHPENQTLIASIASNKEGRNLQKWHKNLIVGLPTTGAICEQLIGRTHRDKQMADEVEVEILFTCAEHIIAFQKVMQDARYIQDTTGSPQKLLLAARDFDQESLWGEGPSWEPEKKQETGETENGTDVHVLGGRSGADH